MYSWGYVVGKHRDEWSRELIAQLVWLGYELSRFLPLQVEVEHKIHRGFVDVAWYIRVPSKNEKLYLAVFELETTKSDWPRIRNNAAKIVSLKPLVCFHIFKPGTRLKEAEKEELVSIHHGQKVYVVNTIKGIENVERDLAEAFSREPYLGLKRIAFALSEPYIAAIDWLVEKGFYLTREEAIRFSILHLMNEELGGVPRKSYIPCINCGSFRVLFDFSSHRSVCMKCGAIKKIQRNKTW
jgi:hypothetical protein